MSYGAFITPPAWVGRKNDYSNNPSYTVGSALTLRWATKIDEYNVYLWHESYTNKLNAVSAPIFYKSSKSDETNGFAWTVDPGGFDLSVSNTFYMTLGPNTTLTGAMLSHYFNMTLPTTATTMTQTSSTLPSASSPTTSILSQSSTIANSTVSPTQTTAASSVPTPGKATSPSTPSHSTVNKGLVLGLALGLGIPIILLLLYLALRASRRRSKSIPSGQSISRDGVVPGSKFSFLSRDTNRAYSPVEAADQVHYEKAVDDSPYQSPGYVWMKPVELSSSPR